MMSNLADIMDEEIKREVSKINSLDSKSPEYARAIEMLSKLYKERVAHYTTDVTAGQNEENAEIEKDLNESKIRIEEDRLQIEKERLELDNRRAEIDQNKIDAEKDANETRLEIEKERLELDNRRADIDQNKIDAEKDINEAKIALERERLELDNRRADVEKARDDIEKDRLEIERERLEIDKQKNDLEIARLKHEKSEGWTRVGMDVVGCILKTAVEAAAIVVPVIFYGEWIKEGLKFEQTGAFTSGTLRTFIGKLRPTKK